MPVTTGQTAPDATVFRFPREAVRLASLRGRKHVLLFFPLAFTSVCTTEMCTMAEDFTACCVRPSAS
jgi:peroxiredoxin